MQPLDVSQFPCPVLVPDGEKSPAFNVNTGTACLTFIDQAVVAEVWEDLLFDGMEHSHGAGSLMLNSAAFGLHLDHDGDFPVTVTRNDDGKVLGFTVDLDPYRYDLDSGRYPDGWTKEQEHALQNPVATEPHHHRAPDGWSAAIEIPLLSSVATFGDPASLPDADNTGGFLTLLFPSAGGTVHASVFLESNVRRYLRAAWTAAN